MRLALAAVIGALLSLGAPASAGAAQRYASPSGVGETCSQEIPCSLGTAVSKAKAEDEVIVTGGLYSISEAISTPEVEGLDIHGDFGGPMPKVTTTIGGKFFILRKGSSLRYLEIIDTGAVNADALISIGLTERVRVTAIGKGAVATELAGEAVVRDSLFEATGTNAFAVFGAGASPTATLRNVTAIASGEGAVAISSFHENPELGNDTLDLKNVIARGQGVDLEAAGSAQGTATIAVSNSNFARVEANNGGVILAGSNDQVSTPLFLSPATGDFHEAPGSPTIDAGVIDQLGALDLDGRPRVLGSAPDIGAYEFVPAPAPAGEILSIAISPRRFRVGPLKPSTSAAMGRAAALGATVSFRLSAAATAAFSFEQMRLGHLRAGKCRKGAARRGGPAKRCRYFSPLQSGAFTREAPAGVSQFALSGRLDGKPLRPGGYRLVARANGGGEVRAPFTVLP